MNSPIYRWPKEKVQGCSLAVSENADTTLRWLPMEQPGCP